MKELFSIGEASSLLGVSAQTIRFYSNNGLIQPHRVDPDSGYRYFSYHQLHIIDRIKYLQSLGFSLTDIKDALQSGQVEDLLPYLERRREKALEEMERAKSVAKSLQWYIDYYRYLGDNRFPHIPYKKTFPTRYILAADIHPHEELFGPGGYRLTNIKREARLEGLEYLRQNGYLLEFESLMEGAIRPLCYFVYLRRKTDIRHPAVREIPEGEYLCFRGKILTNDWDSSLVIQCFQGQPPASLVVADEYEDNLREFVSCTYEVQIRL